LPPRTWITRSVHERAELAAAGPVTAVVVGAVRETGSKPAGHPALGGVGLTDLVAASTVPVVAIGGLSAADWPQLHRAGAAGLAAIGAFLPRSGESVEGAVHRAAGEFSAVVDSLHGVS
jgi:thiamine monophosphate synthase